MSSSQNSSSSSDRPDAAVSAPLTPLHDVVCTVDVILGSASMSVRDCLRLQPDAIVRLAQSAGDEMQVMINGVTVARGEVMIVEDSTAVRLTEILPPPSSEIVQ
jgi:flagellar motor switch protein FliN/FliY